MRKNLKNKTINSKKSIVAALLLFILMLSMCCTVLAESYSTTVSFKNPYNGVMREFSGNNIQYSATMKSSKSGDTGTYEISLQKKKRDLGFRCRNKQNLETSRILNS